MSIEYEITEQKFKDYEAYLCWEEKSHATIEKYMVDIRKLKDFVEHDQAQEVLIQYKQFLCEKTRYKTSSINSFLAAANSFFKYMGWHELHIKTVKVQKEVFAPEERELTHKEFKELVKAAKENGKEKMTMVIQIICATGMRVSEVQCVTVNAVKKGVITIYNKGEVRTRQ